MGPMLEHAVPIRGSDVAMNAKCFKTGAKTKLKRPTRDNPNNDCFRACHCTTSGSPRGGFLNHKRNACQAAFTISASTHERGEHVSTCGEEMPGELRAWAWTINNVYTVLTTPCTHFGQCHFVLRIVLVHTVKNCTWTPSSTLWKCQRFEKLICKQSSWTCTIGHAWPTNMEWMQCKNHKWSCSVSEFGCDLSTTRHCNDFETQ